MPLASSAARSSIATSSEQAILFPWDTPAEITADDPTSLEVGLRFSAGVAGTLIGVRFWMPSEDTTPTITVRAWSSGGTSLATKDTTGFMAGGWVRVNFDTPIDLAAGTVYVVSRNVEQVGGITYLPLRLDAFTNPVVVGDLTALGDGNNGVYSTTPGTFPTLSFQRTNYFVDPIFRRSDAAAGSGTANVAWGPDFGESSDNNTFTVGASAAMTDLALEGNFTVGDQITMDALAAVYTGPTAGSHLSGTALGAPFWQSEAHAALTAAASQMTVSVPSGTADGDLLLAFIYTNDAVAARDINTPAGWTLVDNKGEGAGFARCFRRIAASEPASYVFGFAGSVANATGEIHRLAGTDGTTPIDASATASHPATDLVTNPVCPAVTTTVVNTLVFAWLAHDHLALSQSHTPPGSHTEETDFESSTGTPATKIGTEVSWRVFAAIGSTGTATVTCTNTVATSHIAMRIAIRPGTLTLAA